MGRLGRKYKKTREYSLEQFRENKEDPHEKHIWKAVKHLKGKFMPKFIQMRNRNGMLVPLRKRAEAIADYLEQQHEQNNQAEGENRKANGGFLRKIQKEKKRKLSVDREKRYQKKN